MREILLVNPHGKEGKKMGKKKGQKKGAKKRARNPAANPRVGKLAKKASRAVGRSLLGLDFKHVLGKMLYYQLGMWGSKWAAKRLDGGASETDPESWTVWSFVKGALGGTGLALLMNQIKRGSGTPVLEGALNLMLFKLIQNKLVAQSEWATAQFGAEDEYVPTEYLLTGSPENPLTYDMYGNLMPADDRHRLPEVSGVLEPPGRLGSVLEPVGPLGADPWAKAFIG